MDLQLRTLLLAFVIFQAMPGYHRVCAEVQTMRVAPVDTSVKQGEMVVLGCEVDHIKGNLQWAKGGILLGSKRDLPGFPRYSMIGNKEAGEYGLMIRAAQLDDDAEYQCQVSPAGGEPALIGTAQLSVLVPPRLLEVEGHPNGSVVKVLPDETSVNLTCASLGGKEAATLTWMRDGQPLEHDGDDGDGGGDDDRTATVVYEVVTQPDKLENARSFLTLRPKKTDNGATFTCEAKNEAMRAPMRVVVVLSVMHAPGVPLIDGYTPGSVLRTGDTLRLVCTSRGGNPLARVYWYRDDVEVDFSYTSGAGRADNELDFTVKPSDNGAVYRCDADSVVLDAPLSAAVTLDVQFAPAKVTISGHQHAKAGEMITLVCETAISNPPAVITWFSMGRQLTGAESMTVRSPKGGWVTTSEIEVMLTDREDNVIYTCQGTNDALGQTEIDTVTLEVMYPPHMPTISGYTEGREVAADQIQSLTCTAVGGNPTATLTWWKDWELMESVSTTRGNIASSKVSFILTPDDNTVLYRCNATSMATEEPLITTVQLQVNFPPASLTVRSEPAQARAGQPLVIWCRSGSSKPASVLTWWHDGAEVTGLDDGVEPAAHAGQSTVSRLQLTPTAEDDGQIYACSATNSLLKRAVSDAVTLDILYAPVFTSVAPVTVDITEHANVTLNVSAHANPDNITYTWYRGGVRLPTAAPDAPVSPAPGGAEDVGAPAMMSNGGQVYVEGVTRDQAGVYQCEASNEEGRTRIDVNLNVLYGATLTVLTPHRMVDAGANATFECVSDANPAAAPEWGRAGYEMGAKTTTRMTESGGALLTVVDATKDDSGVFVCSAANGIGQRGETHAELVVKYSPEIDRSPALSKAAADKGTTATLICKADGAPDITFQWFKDSVELDASGVKYATAAAKTGLVHYQSELLVFNITDDDYAQYECIAQNELGQDSTLITLDGTSKPDPPFDLHKVNATHDSITIGWTAGFDGGTRQWFQVRYSQVKVIGQKYEDVMPSTATIYSIKGLKLATEYEMTVRAVNRLGASSFSTAAIRMKTALVAPLSAEGANDTPLIIILTVCIIGLLLLALNILLILYFIRRRKRKLEKESSESCSHANTVEMFSGPTSVEDSKSYASYDHRSATDFPDDYRIYDDEDEVKRFLPSAYPEMYSPGTSTYQSLPRRDRPPPSPDMDRHRAFVVGNENQDPALADRNWQPPQTFVPYPDARTPSSTVPDESHDYADQLRKRQIKAPADMNSQGVRIPAPAPPQRSSSKGAADNGPVVPSRNYQPTDAPRYGPAPSNAYAGSGHPASQRSPDTLGHLV